MIEYIIPALAVGFSVGAAFGCWWKTLSSNEYAATLKRRIEVLKVVNTALHQELDVHVKRKLAADAQRREAGKLGNAAQAAKKISKDTQARLIQQATHDGMRAKLGLGELV